jgi:hypothetical protein
MRRTRFAALSCLFLTASGATALPSAAPAETTQAKPAPACNTATLSALTEKSATAPFVLKCSVTLPAGSLLTRNIIIEGSDASGVTLDCNGGTIDTAANKGRVAKTAVIVRSRRADDGHWQAPRFVTIRNCTINGFIRIYGLNENANGANMKASSMTPGHTQFAQAAAPSRTSLLNLTINAPQGIPLYIGPGVTGTTLANSRLTGRTTSTAVYIDAESAGNSIVDNVFSIRTEKRELIAIDGSARNEITGNVFNDPVNGGIYLYRNCGEGGVIRHQAPNFNMIADNTFNYAADAGRAKPAVWLGSRAGRQRYCFSDPARRFGSSESPMDFARKNTVEGNLLVGGGPGLIRNDDKDNVVRDNRGD